MAKHPKAATPKNVKTYSQRAYLRKTGFWQRNATAVNHTILAIGAACASALAVIPEAGAIDWRHVAVVAAGTFLAAEGIGYAKRQAP